MSSLAPSPTQALSGSRWAVVIREKISARSRQRSGSARAPLPWAVRVVGCCWSAWVEKEEEVVVAAGERRGGGSEVRWAVGGAAGVGSRRRI